MSENCNECCDSCKEEYNDEKKNLEQSHTLSAI